MSNWNPIHYREFYDVPRTFVVPWEDGKLLFDCPFNEDLDEYHEVYQVYFIPFQSIAELEGSWENLPKKAVKR